MPSPQVNRDQHRATGALVSSKNGWWWKIQVTYGYLTDTYSSHYYGHENHARRKAERIVAREQKRFDRKRSFVVGNKLEVGPPPAGPGAGSLPRVAPRRTDDV